MGESAVSMPPPHSWPSSSGRERAHCRVQRNPLSYQIVITKGARPANDSERYSAPHGSATGATWASGNRHDFQVPLNGRSYPDAVHSYGLLPVVPSVSRNALLSPGPAGHCQQRERRVGGQALDCCCFAQALMWIFIYPISLGPRSAGHHLLGQDYALSCGALAGIRPPQVSLCCRVQGAARRSRTCTSAPCSQAHP